MVKAYNLKAFSETDASHKQCMAQMAAASKVQGEQGTRSIQLFQQLAGGLLEPEEVAEYGLKVGEAAAEAWATSKVYEVQSLDAVALALGVTRQDLLDELAALPPTF